MIQWPIALIFGVAFAILVGLMAFRSGRSLALRKSGNAYLQGSVEMHVPISDLWCVFVEGDHLKVSLHRADRVAVNVSNCDHRTVLLSGLTDAAKP